MPAPLTNEKTLNWILKEIEAWFCRSVSKWRWLTCHNHPCFFDFPPIDFTSHSPHSFPPLGREGHFWSSARNPWELPRFLGGKASEGLTRSGCDAWAKTSCSLLAKKLQFYLFQKLRSHKISFEKSISIKKQVCFLLPLSEAKFINSSVGPRSTSLVPMFSSI